MFERKYNRGTENSLYPLGVVWVHPRYEELEPITLLLVNNLHCFRGGTNGNLLVQRGRSTRMPMLEKRNHSRLPESMVCIRMSNPSDLGSKALDVILLPVQNVLGHKHRERAVPHAHLLDALVEPILNLLPDEVRRGLRHVSARVE